MTSLKESWARQGLSSSGFEVATLFLYCCVVPSLVFSHDFRYKKLEDLLEKSFSLVKMPSIQPVVMCVMKHLPKVGPLHWLAWCDVVCHWCDISGVTSLLCLWQGGSAPSAPSESVLFSVRA